MIRIRIPLATALVPAALAAATLLAAQPARAQAAYTPPSRQLGGNGVPNVAKSDESQKRFEKQAAPAALPGAIDDPSKVAPAQKAAADMSPNDALFDAINRGDLDAARDAISRGAQLNAQNVLGMTPLDLSVDLGRNSITFYLLSQRNGDEPVLRRVAPAPAHAVASSAAPAARVAAPRATQVASKPAEAAQKPAPQQYVSSDPGTPNPAAGFLGFGLR